MILAKNGEKMVFLKNRFFSTFVGKRALILEKKVQKSGFFRFFRPSFFRSFSGVEISYMDMGGLWTFLKKGVNKWVKKGVPKTNAHQKRVFGERFHFLTPFFGKILRSVNSEIENAVSRAFLNIFDRGPSGPPKTGVGKKWTTF